MNSRKKDESPGNYRFTSQEEMLGDCMTRTSALWVERCLEYYRDEPAPEPAIGNAGMYDPENTEKPEWP
jgi:hypothetical protein